MEKISPFGAILGSLNAIFGQLLGPDIQKYQKFI